MTGLPQSGLYAVAALPVLSNVANANPCMGSFVGRDATTTHTTKCGRVTTNRRGNSVKRMTDFGGQQ